MMAYFFFFFQLFLLTIVPVLSEDIQEIVWYEPMNIDISNTNWNVVVNNEPTLHLANDLCPLGSDCWELCSQSNYFNAYIWKNASTIGYTNVSLQFNIAPHGITNPDNEWCSFSYNIDNVGNQNWVEVFRWNQEQPTINKTILLNESVSNNIGVGIKIWAANSDDDCCWISNVYLMGNTLSTQTSNTSTTQMPVTASTTTIVPTSTNSTSISSTSTNNVESTATRTTASTLITSEVTQHSTEFVIITTETDTKSVTDSNDDIVNNQSEAFIEINPFVIVMIIVLVCLCSFVFLIVCIKKRRSNASENKMASHVGRRRPPSPDNNIEDKDEHIQIKYDQQDHNLRSAPDEHLNHQKQVIANGNNVDDKVIHNDIADDIITDMGGNINEDYNNNNISTDEFIVYLDDDENNITVGGGVHNNKISVDEFIVYADDDKNNNKTIGHDVVVEGENVSEPNNEFDTNTVEGPGIY